MAPSIADNQDIRAALERYTKDELVDLMEQLLRIYVLEEPVKLDQSLSKPETMRELSGYSFAQVLSQLQTSLELEELERFRVTPYTVYVRIGELELDMNGPTPQLRSARDEEERADERDDDDERLSPAQKLDGITSRPWRNDHVAKANKAPSSSVETPSMADLFANDKAGREYNFFTSPPEGPEDLEEAPPIAELAPGDDPKLAPSSSESTDFAKTAASREDAPKPPAAAPPALAEGDKQIDPSNRFASLDLD